MLINSYGTDCVLRENKDLNQYGSYDILSKIMPCYNFPVHLVNQHSVPVELPYYRQRPITQIFDVSFDLGPSKRLSKQSRRW